MTAPVLVAGVGNIFFGDDGFGVEVARTLAREPPEGVDVVDYGIRGVHLAFDLLLPRLLVIIVDALSRRRPPGTLYLVDPGIERIDPVGPADAHTMDLGVVLAFSKRLAQRSTSMTAPRSVLPPVRILGCEPESTEEHLGLSHSVEAAVQPALRRIRELIVEEGGSREPTPRLEDDA